MESEEAESPHLSCAWPRTQRQGRRGAAAGTGTWVQAGAAPQGLQISADSFEKPPQISLNLYVSACDCVLGTHMHRQFVNQKQR